MFMNKDNFCLFSKIYYLFILLCWILVAACGIQFPIRDPTWAPCIGLVESQALNHQRSLRITFFFKCTLGKKITI